MRARNYGFCFVLVSFSCSAYLFILRQIIVLGPIESQKIWSSSTPMFKCLVAPLQMGLNCIDL